LITWDNSCIRRKARPEGPARSRQRASRESEIKREPLGRRVSEW